MRGQWGRGKGVVGVGHRGSGGGAQGQGGGVGLRGQTCVRREEGVGGGPVCKIAVPPAVVQ